MLLSVVSVVLLYAYLICVLRNQLRHDDTFFMTIHHNITFELYLNVQTVISGQCWSVLDRYGLLTGYRT